MRSRIFVLLPAALCFNLFSVLPSVVSAQSDTVNSPLADAPQDDGLNRANSNPGEPALKEILSQWEQHTANIQTLSGKYRRTVFDTVFEVEMRSDGLFYYKAPDKGRIDLEPAEINSDEVSNRKGSTGKPYSIRPGLAEKWICDGRNVAQAVVQQKVYGKYGIPPAMRGRNVMNGPLPFLFGLPAEKAQERYVIRINKDTNADQVCFYIMPRRKPDRIDWVEAEVILDRQTFLPLVVKLKDTSRSRETVYDFAELHMNEKAAPVATIFSGGDPLDIDNVFKDFKNFNDNRIGRGEASDSAVIQ